MAEWIKTLAVSMCILTILMHLIPNGKYTKYVRFYAGLLFFLLAVKPLLGLFGESGEFERLLGLEFLKEEYYEMETAIEGMEGWKQEEIRRQYQKEIIRQIKEVASAYGLYVGNVDAQFGAEGGYGLTEIGITLEHDVQQKGNTRETGQTEEPAVSLAAREAVKRELEEVYAIDREHIWIGIKGE